MEPSFSFYDDHQSNLSMSDISFQDVENSVTNYGDFPEDSKTNIGDMLETSSLSDEFLAPPLDQNTDTARATHATASFGGNMASERAEYFDDYHRRCQRMLHQKVVP